MRRRQCLRLLGAAAALLAGCGREAAEPVLAAGKPMPALQLPDLAGRPVQVGGGGAALLLNFWATWCPPCRAEMAGLERLYRRLRGAGLGLFGISIDDDANLVREFVLQSGVSFPVLLDRSGALTRDALALQGFPTTILVGRDGRVAEVVVGERSWDEPPIFDRVRRLVA